MSILKSTLSGASKEVTEKLLTEHYRFYHASRNSTTIIIPYGQELFIKSEKYSEYIYRILKQDHLTLNNFFYTRFYQELKEEDYNLEAIVEIKTILHLSKVLNLWERKRKGEKIDISKEFKNCNHAVITIIKKKS